MHQFAYRIVDGKKKTKYLHVFPVDPAQKRTATTIKSATSKHTLRIAKAFPSINTKQELFFI